MEMPDLATPLPAGVYLRPGSSVFQLRIGVPKDLQQFFRDPKTRKKPRADAYRASLKTSNCDEAITRALRIIAECRERFAALRDQTRPASFVPLTPELEAYIVRAIERRLLDTDDFARANPGMHSSRKYIKRQGIAAVTPGQGPYSRWGQVGNHLTPDQLRTVASINQGHRQAMQLDAAVGKTDTARKFADGVCESLSVRVDWDSPDGRVALQRIMRAVVRQRLLPTLAAADAPMFRLRRRPATTGGSGATGIVIIEEYA